MTTSSFVLKALKILGFAEILRLTSILQSKQVLLKKAAGEELISWDDTPEPHSITSENREGNVIAFPKKKNIPETTATEIHDDNESCSPVDILLWQREVVRNSGENNQKLDAFKGYKKASEMYVVKTSDEGGKDKIRFASTNGVLVNKKQA